MLRRVRSGFFGLALAYPVVGWSQDDDLISTRDNEAIIHNIHTWEGASCDDVLGNPPNTTWSNDTAENWIDEIADFGSFDRNVRADNGVPSTRSLTTFDTEGMFGIDAFDVALLFTHGMCYCQGNTHCEEGANRTWLAYAESGSSTVTSDSCTADTLDEITLGGTGTGDLELFYTMACHSAQKCVYENGGLNVWGERLRIYAGFHGSHVGTYALPGHVKDFVRGSRTSGAGSHWLEDLHYHAFTTENCPVVAIRAGDMLSATYYHLYGGFQAGAYDRHRSLGTPANTYEFFVEGCTPRNGNTL